MKYDQKIMKDALERTAGLLLECAKSQNTDLREMVATIFSSLLLLSVDAVEAVDATPTVLIYQLNGDDQDEGYPAAPDEVRVLADGRAIALWDEDDRERGFPSLAEVMTEYGSKVFESSYRTYRWTAVIDVAEKWVEDGFDLTEDRLQAIFGRELSSATSSEYDGEILSAPSQHMLDVATGKTRDR